MTGQELKQLRLELGVPIQALAQMAHVSANTIQQVEKELPLRIEEAPQLMEQALTEYKQEIANRHEAERTSGKKKAKSTSLADENAMAKMLGISYGTYMAYKETGYLGTFLKQQDAMAERDKGCNIIVSAIGCASNITLASHLKDEDTRCTDDNHLI